MAGLMAERFCMLRQSKLAEHVTAVTKAIWQITSAASQREGRPPMDV